MDRSNLDKSMNRKRHFRSLFASGAVRKGNVLVLAAPDVA